MKNMDVLYLKLNFDDQERCSNTFLKSSAIGWCVIFLILDRALLSNCESFMVTTSNCLTEACWLLFSSSPTSDGAGAAILASEEFVRRNGLENKAVEIIAQEMVTDLSTTFEENSCLKMVRLTDAETLNLLNYRK